MLSVIIPTYNRLELLKITLDNIFSQTLPADEIIVVDDHSSDGTFEYLTRNQSDKVIAVQTKGKGPAAARNTGLSIATGDLIQFFDSDDLITRNKFEVQAKLLGQSGNSIIIGPYVKAIEQNKTWKQLDVILQYRNLPPQLPFSDWILRGWCSITQACMFKRDLIKAVGKWNESLMPHEDLEYWFRLSKENPYPLHSNETCVIYRQHGAQITEDGTTLKRKIRDGLNALTAIQRLRSSKHTFLSNLLFDARVYHQNKQLYPVNQFNKELKYFIYRLYNKYERLRTHTNWERMHGPCADPKVFQDFISML